MSTIDSAKLLQINELLEKGIISSSEFEIEKSKIMNPPQIAPISNHIPIQINNHVNSSNGVPKSKLVTFILCLFLGFFGIHRFYTGHIITGILYMLSLGFFGIGIVIDILYIITGSYRDANGNVLK